MSPLFGRVLSDAIHSIHGVRSRARVYVLGRSTSVEFSNVESWAQNVIRRPQIVLAFFIVRYYAYYRYLGALSSSLRRETKERRGWQKCTQPKYKRVTDCSYTVRSYTKWTLAEICENHV